MIRRGELLAGIALLLGSSGVAPGAADTAPPVAPFAAASVHLEQNVTEEDMEIVFEVDGGGDGLAKLVVIAPDGRTVIDFTAPGTSSLGIRQFRLESPEPEDVERVKAAYPEGVYLFTGTTAAGAKLQGKSTLTHKLPARAALLRPGATKAVGADGVEVAWNPVQNLTGYVITIEQDLLHVNITATLPASGTTFAVPAGFLRPGTKYALSLGTVAGEGNMTVVETTFTTAGTRQ